MAVLLLLREAMELSIRVRGMRVFVRISARSEMKAAIDAPLMGRALGNLPVSGVYICTHSILKLSHSFNINISTPLQRFTQTVSVGRIHSVRNGNRPVV